MIQFITVLAFTVFAYLVGSISTAILVAKCFGLPNPTEAGSKNPGTTNMLRLGGKKAAAFVFLGDFFKGLVVIVCAKFFLAPAYVAWIGIAVVLGHMFPIFFHFKGGKGVATGAGVIVGLSWQLGVLVILCWILTVVLFRYSSLGAVFAAIVSPFLTAWIVPRYLDPLIVMNLLILWRHQDNIVRLIKGNEMKIGFRERERS